MRDLNTSIREVQVQLVNLNPSNQEQFKTDYFQSMAQHMKNLEQSINRNLTGNMQLLEGNLKSK